MTYENHCNVKRYLARFFGIEPFCETAIMTRIELNNIIQDLETYKSIVASCESCTHFRKNRMCEYFEKTVPDEFVKHGCDHWLYEFDTIQF